MNWPVGGEWLEEQMVAPSTKEYGKTISGINKVSVDDMVRIVSEKVICCLLQGFITISLVNDGKVKEKTD